MKVLLDTCVVIDFLQKREPFAAEALEIFRRAVLGEYSAFITAKAATDIFYLSHRNTHSNEESRLILQRLLRIVGLLDTSADDVTYALLSDGTDFEDNVMARTAERTRMDGIITRNGKHYEKSAVPVYSPEAFLCLTENE